MPKATTGKLNIKSLCMIRSLLIPVGLIIGFILYYNSEVLKILPGVHFMYSTSDFSGKYRFQGNVYIFES